MVPHRILVADDDESFARALYRWFQRNGYDCVTARSGAEALALALQRSPDAIVLDLRLRDMTGFDVINRLRQDGRTAGIPVVMMTGEKHASDLLEGAARSAKVAALLRKPFDLEELLREVRRALGVSEARPATDPWVIERSGIRIDLRHKSAFVGGKQLDLGPKRFEVLCALAKSKDGMPNTVLRTLVWGNDHEPINTVAKTVRRLRRDLENACGTDLIVPIAGGYRLQ